MSFSDDFGTCLSPLPTPGDIADPEKILDFIERLHSAWEASGGDDEMLLGTLAAGAATGLDEVAAAAAGVTVLAYLSACAACAVRAAGSSIWDAITASSDSYASGLLTVAANDQGIQHDTAIA